MHEVHVLVNCLFKLAQEKKCGYVGTGCPAMTIAVDLGHKATKQTNKQKTNDWMIVLSIIVLKISNTPSVFKYNVAGFPPALEIMKNLKSHPKISLHGKIMEFEKNPE